MQEKTKAESVDRDISREYERQREYLERCVEVLKAKLTTDSAKHKGDNMLLMQTNMAFIKEISDYRTQIKGMKLMKNSSSGKKKGSRSKKKVGNTGVSEETLRVIQGKRDELGDLRMKFENLKRSKAFAKASDSMARAVSRERLPPMDGVSPRLPEINPAS